MNRIALFDDQIASVAALRLAFREHRSVCFQLPTGGGKTIIAGWLPSRCASAG